MNSLCLQLWVVLYSWNSRPVLTSNSDWRKAGSKLLTLPDPPPHSLFQHLCLFCCVFFFFSFVVVFLPYLPPHSLWISNLQFYVRKKVLCVFCRKPNVCNFCWQKWFTHFVRKLFARSNLPSEKSGYMIMIIIQSCKNVQTMRSSRCYFFWPVLIFGKSTQKTANFWEKHAKNC